MSRRSSPKSNAQSRSIDEDGIRPTFSEMNARLETAGEDGIGPSSYIGSRDIYGIGLTTLFADLDVEEHRVILERRVQGRSTIIPLFTADEAQRLVRYLTMAQKYLPREQSA